MAIDALARGLAIGAAKAVTAADFAGAAVQTAADRAATTLATSIANVPVFVDVAFNTVLPKGVKRLDGAVGSGTLGTAGTYKGGVVGGPAGFAWQYTIANGSVSKVEVTNPGISTTTDLPTLSYSGGGGLTAPTLPTPVVDVLVLQQAIYFSLAPDGSALLAFKNDGTATPAKVLDPLGRQFGLFSRAYLDGVGISLVSSESGHILAFDALDDDKFTRRTFLSFDQTGAAKFALPPDFPAGSLLYVQLSPQITSRMPVLVSGESGNIGLLEAIFDDGFTIAKLVTYNLLTMRLEANVDAKTALSLARVASKPGTNYKAVQYQDASENWQVRTHNRATGALANITTSGNNIDVQMDGDTVVWVDEKAQAPAVKHKYAPASGIQLLTGGLIKADIPGLRIHPIGDSETQGSGSTLIGTNVISPEAGSIGCYPSRVQNLLGSTWLVGNDGYSAHTTEQILSRMNDNNNPITINVTGAVIPASGPVTVTSITPFPLTGGADNPGRGPMMGRDGGKMRGWASVNGQPGVPVSLIAKMVNGNTTYTLERETPGNTGFPWPDGTRFWRDLSDKDDRLVIYMGGRNFTNVSQIIGDDALVERNIRSNIKRFLAMPIILKRDSTENTGTAQRGLTDQVNDAKAARWGHVGAGGRFLDLNKFYQQLGPFGPGSGTITAPGGTNAAGAYVSTGTSMPGWTTNADGTLTFPDAYSIMNMPSPAAGSQDLSDIQQGRTPQTWLSTTDNLHPSDLGYEAMARFIYQVIIAKGWNL